MEKPPWDQGLLAPKKGHSIAMCPRELVPVVNAGAGPINRRYFCFILIPPRHTGTGKTLIVISAQPEGGFDEH